MQKKRIRLINLALYSSIFFSVTYLAVRATFLVFAKYCWYENIIGILLLFSELFILIHGIGYITEIYKVISSDDREGKECELKSNPIVAVVIPSFHEPLNVLENTINTCFNMTYKNKYIFLLDDTKYETETEELKIYKRQIEDLCARWKIALFRRKWRGAKAGILNDFIAFTRNRRTKHFFCKEFGRKTKFENIKYLAIFDADQNPFLNFLEPLVASMEKEPSVAFIQTPQYYTNFTKSRVASAAGLQQGVFYEFICEGKSLSNAMYCCGTNVLLRMKALEEVGGFDEESVTEDFATSFKIHLKKWSTRYYKKVGVFGMGPEDLGSYFKQQYRWALGTLSLLKTIVITLFKNPGKMSFIKWWEYLLSGSYYFVGIVLFLFMLFPILFLFFDIPSFFIDFRLYSVIFLPYFFLGLFVFFITLLQRGYRLKEVVLGQMLVFQCFPIYIKAAFDALRGKKGKFVVTTKGKTSALPLSALWVQVVMSILIFSAIVWGFNRIIFENSSKLAIGANVFWSIYNFIVLSFLFYFNSPEKKGL